MGKSQTGFGKHRTGEIPGNPTPKAVAAAKAADKVKTTRPASGSDSNIKHLGNR